VPSIQELGEVHGAARGPGLGLVQVDEKRSHHMVLAEGPEEPLAGLGVVVGHAEHVAWGAESIVSRSLPAPALLQMGLGQPGGSTGYQAAPIAAKTIWFNKSEAISKTVGARSVLKAQPVTRRARRLE